MIIMLTYIEFANLIEECIKTSKILNEDNAIAFAQGVILPYLLKQTNNYIIDLKLRKKAAFKDGGNNLYLMKNYFKNALIDKRMKILIFGLYMGMLFHTEAIYCTVVRKLLRMMN